ncbi:MAG: hypothetical protein MUO61_05275 [Dehalococcoidia bacterium]|nr:hypothetical protein [Dehalococcoidia bacterium]
MEIFDSNGVKIKPYQRIFPSILRLMNAQGREYFCDFTLFYDHYSKKLLFDKPGTYTVSVIACETRCVPPLEVTVRPETDLTGEAPSLQLDPNAALFMELGLYENEKTRVEAMSKLMQMTKQYGGHPLAKWSAGRLGLEYYKNFLTKYPMFNQLSSEQRSVAIKDELFTQATTLLDKATSLPDEFPLREEVLYKLSSAEYMDGNHKRTASLLDELAAKYPYGEYGKRAASAKKELLGLAKQQKLTPSFWTRPSFLIIAAVGIGIVVISIIFLLKKKVTT